ncbi:MAG TPA: hypothetical protein PLW10_03440, partial [Myxococcota bacterium]|nr:hypothetical protein [Myxococcota bacterium]
MEGHLPVCLLVLGIDLDDRTRWSEPARGDVSSNRSGQEAPQPLAEGIGASVPTSGRPVRSDPRILDRIPARRLVLPSRIGSPPHDPIVDARASAPSALTIESRQKDPTHPECEQATGLRDRHAKAGRVEEDIARHAAIGDPATNELDVAVSSGIPSPSERPANVCA